MTSIRVSGLIRFSAAEESPTLQVCTHELSNGKYSASQVSTYLAVYATVSYLDISVAPHANK